MMTINLICSRRRIQSREEKCHGEPNPDNFALRLSTNQSFCQGIKLDPPPFGHPLLSATPNSNSPNSHCHLLSSISSTFHLTLIYKATKLLLSLLLLLIEIVSSSKSFPINFYISLIVVNFKLGLILTLFLFLGLIIII